MSTKVWLDIVDIVEDKFVDENQRIRKYSNDEESLEEAIEKFLEQNENVTQFEVTNETLFDSPGYETGAVFAAWIESNGQLNSVTYQWENY